MRRQLVAAGELAWHAARRRYAMAALCAVGTSVLPVLAAWCTRSVINELAGAGGDPSGRGHGHGPLYAAVGLVGVGLALAVLAPVARYVRADSDRAVGLVAQDRLFAAVDRGLGLAWFEDPVFLDRLRVAQQAGAMAPGQIVYGVIDVAGGVVSISGYLGSLLVLSPLLAIVAVVAAAPVLVAEWGLSRRRAAMMWTVSPVERRELFYSRLLTSVEASKEIRLFGTGRFLRRRMMADRATSYAERRGMDRRELAVHGGLGTVSAIVSGGGLLVAVTAAWSGRIGVGDVTVLIAAVGGVQAAVATMTSAVAAMNQQLLMFDHYLAVLHATPDLPAPARPRPLPALRHGIELRDVWFRYSEHHPWVLRGVTMFIPHGRATALVGRNGCGKTTLVKLLCRFYDPTAGAILWDGVDLRELPVEELRRRIGAVFQDFMCYELTAAENVGLGDMDAMADRPRIEAAAGLAGVHDTLAHLPHGYDTLLTRTFLAGVSGSEPATGVVLSGGQWQRIALARALLRDRADLVILDEPSSGLDAVAEQQVHQRLRAHRYGRTSLLISHRLGATRDAEQIVVLAGGRVAEVGTHDELMALGGDYTTLFTLQADGYRSEPAVTLKGQG